VEGDNPHAHACLAALGTGSGAPLVWVSGGAGRLSAALAARSAESGTGMLMDFTLLHNDSAVCVCLLAAPLDSE
jgi:hypothetical protein